MRVHDLIRVHRRVRWTRTVALWIGLGLTLVIGIASGVRQARTHEPVHPRPPAKPALKSQAVAIASNPGSANPLPQPSPAPSAQAKLAEGYGRLPLSFEANRGQIDNSVEFVAHGRDYTIFLTGTEALLSFKERGSQCGAPNHATHGLTPPRSGQPAAVSDPTPELVP